LEGLVNVPGMMDAIQTALLQNIPEVSAMPWTIQAWKKFKKAVIHYGICGLSSCNQHKWPIHFVGMNFRICRCLYLVLKINICHFLFLITAKVLLR
jgi:hypothetical protein